MSSSPPQLHLSLPPNTTSFKRSFEQFGFDLESPSGPRAHDSIDGTSTSASGQSSSSTSPDGDENRRKRARSAGSLSDPEDRSSEESSSTLSSFHSEPSSADSHLSHQTSSQAAARRHLLLDLGLGRGLGSSVALGLSMASAELQLGGGRATEPPPRIPTPDLLESDDIEMPDIDMDFSHSEEHEDRQTSHAEHVRRSVDRFNTFDRHISVLRSSSPPVIPLPASLSSRQASQSPPTLPPLPLVDLGLDADDNNHDNNLSTQITTTTTNTPPRLNLNLPPTTSLSSVPSSPSAARDASSSSSSAQFRERLDSAIDGLGGGDLHFEAPITYNSTSDRFEQRTDDGPMSDRYLEPVQDSSGPSTSNIAARTRLLVETPLSEWPPVIDWDVTLGRPGSSSEAMQPLRSPTFSSWRPRVRPTSATAATNTTNADIRRFIGNSYSPPPHPPPPTRLYPRPVSLAAPLSVQATTSGEAAALDADLVDAYLDFQRSNTNTRAWESALERARTLRQEREQERERIRATDRERERARANQREREEEETDRELEHPWSLDSIWETNARGESYSSSARPRPRDSLTLRARREFMEDNGRELELELSRRRALQRQMHRASDTDRERQLEEQHERGQSSVSRAARYLESGLLDPREASRPMPLPSGREQRSPPDTANPFAITWAPNRGASTGDEEASSSTHRFRSSSHSRESGVNRIPRTEQDEDHGMEAFAEWFNSVPPTYRIANPRTTEPSGEGVDFLRGGGGEPPGSGEWRARTAGAWQPRLAVSRQSTAVPTRTATHARAQSIPISSLSPSLSSLNSVPPRPSLHRLRSRLHGPPRAAGVGSTNSLVAENAAAIRRREARTEFMERLNRTITHDVDDLSDPESDWEPRMRQPARDPPRLDMDLDSDEDHLSLPRRIAEAIDLIGSRPPLRISHRRSDSSPTRSSRPSIGRALFDQDTDEQPTASSSGLNSRRPSSSIHPRRTIPRLRQHHVSGEISPPPQPSAVVDRHHASWEAPSRDTDVSSTYQYLSNLSHGFDSQSVSISDMAHTITSNSETAEDTRRIPPSPPWGETESPFSTLFSRSPRSPSSPAPQRHARYSRPQDMPGRYPDDVMEAIEDPSVPSLPPPDLGRNFERAEDVLRSAHVSGARASSAMGTPTSNTLPASQGSRHPPPFSNFTGPFRLTMQRREEFRAARAAAAAMSPQRIPEPPSIPPLYFGGEFEGSSMQGPSEEGSARRLLAQLNSRPPPSHRDPSPRSERIADAERRLLNYRGPAPTAPSSDVDPRRFFPSRSIPATSGSIVDREPAEQRGPRYSATDMHNVLARQARLEGSRIAADFSHPSRAESDDAVIHDGVPSTSRAQRLMSRYREQVNEEARDFVTQTRWEDSLYRNEVLRAEVEARRRRQTPSRADADPMQFRHRAAFRDPTLQAIFGAAPGGHGAASARFRRRALGDFMRDEDFDASYENLLSLGGMIGDAKPKATPEHILSGLETASYKDWANAESDQRCPICLDDYQASDSVMKLGDCRHWLHKECLEQWLKGASTCPVCRKDVKGKARRVPHHHHHHHHHHGPSRRRDGDGPDGSSGPGTSGEGGGGAEDPNTNWLNFLRD